MLFKHFFRAVGFEGDLSILNGISFGDVDLEMDMVFGKAEFAEFKSKSFEVSESLGAGVDVALFFEVSVSVVGGKHHGNPVVPCVMR